MTEKTDPLAQFRELGNFDGPSSLAHRVQSDCGMRDVKERLEADPEATVWLDESGPTRLADVVADIEEDEAMIASTKRALNQYYRDNPKVIRPAGFPFEES